MLEIIREFCNNWSTTILAGSTLTLVAITTWYAISAHLQLKQLRNQADHLRSQSQHLKEQEKRRLKNAIRSIVDEVAFNSANATFEGGEPVPFKCEAMQAFSWVLYEVPVSRDRTLTAIRQAELIIHRCNQTYSSNVEYSEVWHLAEKHLRVAQEAIESDDLLQEFLFS